jgi:hypothetical protein
MKSKGPEWPRFHSTFDIIEATEKGLLPDKIMMNVHPQRWTDDPVAWTKELILQNGKNVVKRLIIHRRGAKNAKKRDIYLSADPGGIGAAFHRAGRPERKKIPFKNITTLT